MSNRIVLGIVLLIVAFACVVAAGLAWVSVGLYADATGTGGYIPTVSWITAALGAIALVAAVLSFRGPRGKHTDDGRSR